MNLLNPTLWLILSCIVMMIAASALYCKLRNNTCDQRRFRRAHLSIMALGRARLIETLESTIDAGKPVSLGELERIVDETMSVVHFLNVYPGMYVRPRMMCCVERGVVMFVFTSPITRVTIEYRIRRSAYLLP